MSTNHSTQEPQTDDGLDRLLREYFGTKIPRSFPPLPLDAAQPTTPRLQPRSPLSRGRLILAACVAAVVLGFGYLLSTTPTGHTQSPVGFSNSSAHGGTPHATNPSRR